MSAVVIGAALLGVVAYASAWPTAQLFGSTLTGASKGSRVLALTYDDGPNGVVTERLLAMLDREGALGTFFVVGRHVEMQPSLVRTIARAGHAIGNHGYSHRPLFGCSRATIRAELSGCQSAVERASGVRPRAFRPPFGLRSPAVLREAMSMNLAPVSWSVTCFDWFHTTPDAVEGRAVHQISGGDILLLHDGSHVGPGADRFATIEASRRLIRRYRDLGYEFVTVDQLLDDRSRSSAARRK